MRKSWVIPAAVLLVLGAAAAGWLSRSGVSEAQTVVVIRAAEATRFASLPIVLVEHTPTPTATSTATPTATPTPTETPGPTLTPPAGGNWLVNPGFEEGWTNMPPAPGYLINQQPNGWVLKWLEPGETLWDSTDVVTGVPECLHKLKSQLPPNEWPGAPNALILDGETTYKMFHRGAAFGSQLRQTLVDMPAGRYRLTVPIQIHWQEKLDPNDYTWDSYTAESSAWVRTSELQGGGWVNARQMGDRKWFYHVVEFELQDGDDVDILIRVKSKYPSPKDFFVDAVQLERIDALSSAADAGIQSGRAVWLAQPVETIPTAELVTP